MSATPRTDPGYRVGTRTDVGLRRQRNEDYLSVQETPHGLLLVVCDGMGGHVGGERASRLAVQTFVDAVCADQGEPADVLRRGITAANQAVYGESHSVAEYAGMGTTLVAAIVNGTHATVANVGDSRAYYYSGGALRRVTTDHSVVEELVAQGRLSVEGARIHPQRNLITRALGTMPDVEPDTFELDLADDAALLLSSDGLHGMIDDAAIAEILRSQARTEAACDALVRAALDAGGDDNVTVALLRAGGAEAAGPLTDANTLPPGASESPAHGRGGTVWLWLALAAVAAAAAWVLLVARPWETADNLAPKNPPPPIMLDTSYRDLDSVPIDSGEQLTPFDQLNAAGDSVRTARPWDTLPTRSGPMPRPAPRQRDAVTGGR